MSSIQRKNERDATNRQAAELATALGQKRTALSQAAKEAPQGRHAAERAGVENARDQMTGMSNPADRDKVDAFFRRQLEQLEATQRTELDLVNAALSTAQPTADRSPEAQREALAQLSRTVDEIASIHQAQQDQLAAEQSELQNALTVKDDRQRSELIDDLRQRQEDAAAFAERPGAVWSAAEEEQRKQAGATAATDMKQAPRSADEARIDNRHARGNLGERAATEWLAANDYQILNYKPDIKGTTRPGIDMVAMKDDKVYLLDNKALSRSGDVRDVSALTRNLADTDNREGNLARAKRELEKMAGDTKRPAEERALIGRALDALQQDRDVLAVTNANVARDDRRLEGVSQELQKQGIEFIDVMRTAKELAAKKQAEKDLAEKEQAEKERA
jgi:hypothetical protein